MAGFIIKEDGRIELVLGGDPIFNTMNKLTFTAQATGFTIAGGTTSKTLTVTGDCAVDQNLRTTDQPQFLTLRTDEVTNHTVFVGDDAGEGSSGTYSVFVGEHAGQSNSVNFCTALGHQALQNNTGSGSNAVGYTALYGNTGSSCNAFGQLALYLNEGLYCTALGHQTLQNNTGNFCCGFGHSALKTNIGIGCNAFGYRALYENVANYCNAFGHYTLDYSAAQMSNAIGYYALQFNTGTYCNAFGYMALRYNDGDYNTAFGDQSFNTWTDDAGSAKTFAPEDCDPETERVTITGHGFGTGYINLKVSTDDTLPTGLDAGIDQWKIIDVNTLECRTDSFTDGGVGTHTLTPKVVYTNSTGIGYDAEPDASNQIMLGGSTVTQVKSAGSLYMKAAHLNQSVADAAIPPLTLEQADVDQDMIEFISTIGVGNAIEAVDGKTLTVTHFIKTTLPGPLTRYIPVGTIA